MVSNARAIRYRRLALATGDKADANLLLKLADECDQGILCTAEWRSARPPRKNEQPPRAEDAKFRFEWDPLNFVRQRRGCSARLDEHDPEGAAFEYPVRE